jgi:hypothetical protein
VGFASLNPPYELSCRKGGKAQIFSPVRGSEFVVKKYAKYLVLSSLALLLGLGVYHLELLSYVVQMSELVAWVLFVAGAFAIGEKIVGRLFGSRTY